MLRSRPKHNARAMAVAFYDRRNWALLEEIHVEKLAFLYQ